MAGRWVLLCVFGLAALLVGAAAGSASGTEYVPGQILVKFQPGTPASDVARAHAAARSAVIDEIPQIGVQVVGLARGLSVGLKNDLGQVPALVGLFDWALSEQCFQYDECSALFPFVSAGKAVFGVEYRGDPASFCPQAVEWGFSWLRKRPSLGAWAIPCDG